MLAGLAERVGFLALGPFAGWLQVAVDGERLTRFSSADEKLATAPQA